MFALLLASFLALSIQIDQAVEGLTLRITDANGNIVRQIATPKPGMYVVDGVEAGSYRIQATVAETVVATISDVMVPGPILVHIPWEALAQAAAPRQQVSVQRNENIQINLIDNNALNDRLGRDAAETRPIGDFTAVRSDYSVEFGGLGPNINIIASDRKKAYHGELYETLQNSIFNARTFFQVGAVRPSRRNQYGFNFGGPVVRNLSFLITGEEVRQSGYVNGNVLVPLPDERTPRTTDPAVYAIIARWLLSYPKELPNRTEIDPRMLNTNALQKIRTSGGSFRLDWDATTNRKIAARYFLQDTFIDSFKFVAGQNPDQRLRPQVLNLSWNEQLSDRTTLRFGANYLRAKAFLLPPPGAVGPFVPISRQVEDLGPKEQFPIMRVRNDFEYLFQATHAYALHQADWGVEVRRFQMNDLQSDDARGTMTFNPNFGRSSLENFLLGVPTKYIKTFGNLYRGFRNTDTAFFFNDRLKVTSSLQFNLGVRYEAAGAPSEVNNLTRIPYRADLNDFAPRFGFVYGRGKQTVRGGYGIAFGRIFPATFQWTRFSPPEIVRVQLQNPDFLNPLRDFQVSPGGTPRSAVNLLDTNLVTPYSQHYSLEVERELPAGLHLRAAYIGSRTWKLFQLIFGNRAVPVDGVPTTTATVNDRRPDQRHYAINKITNMGRAYFDAGQLALERSAGRGLTLNAAYTFGKVIDTGTEFSNTTVNTDEMRSQNENGIIQDLKAVSRFDARHRLVVTYTWELPTRRLHAWSLVGATLLHSGTPFTVESGSDSPPFGNVDGERQDRPTILDVSLLGRTVDNPDTSQSILRRAAFITDAVTHGRGNIGRNTFRKGGAANFNLALQRSFALSADQSRVAVFRAESINLTNHPQFDAPNFNLATPSFGQITNTLNTGRILQFGFNVKF